MKKAIHSLEETKEFAQDVAKACKSLQLVITLDGDLGAGKTTWTQFFANYEIIYPGQWRTALSY